MDVAEHSPYNVIETPQTAPGHCFITKTPNGPFVDTGIWLRSEGVPLENRGRVIISVDALKEMAEVAGILWDAKKSVEDKYEELLRAEYDKARADVMKEIQDDPIYVASRQLLRAAASGGALVGVAIAADSGEADGASVDGPVDVDESHGFERSDDVPSAPGDDVPFTI